MQPSLHTAFEASLAKHPDAKVWVTGHSLGAALAALLAADLKSVGHDIATVYTMGQVSNIC